MRVWVSGAAGKLGTEVCRQLRAEGHEVLEADARGQRSAAVDLLDPTAVAASMRGAHAIVHCAAIPSPENVTPSHLVENNALSTFHALDEAWKAGIRVAVLASSGSIYGTAWAPDLLAQPYVPVDEDSALQYVDPYALTKDLLEQMGQMYARRGMKVTALRFHWIATTEELRCRAESEHDADGARMLWGYVHLNDAVGACVLALRPSSDRAPFEALLIAAGDTWARQPTEHLLDEYSPQSQRRATFSGTTGLFDCSRAARVIGWAPQAEWRRLTASGQGCESGGGPSSSSNARFSG